MYSVENERRTASAKNRLVTHFTNERHSEGLDYFDYLIYDITGKIIKKENSISNNRLNVFLPQISKGIYYLKINALNYSQTIKLIKE